MRKVILTFVLFLLGLGPIHLAFAGNSTSQTQAMDQAYLSLLKTSTDQNKLKILILPFQDGSQTETDSTLAFGFAVVLSDILNRIELNSAFHPFVGQAVSANLGLSNADLFDESKTREALKNVGATHAVIGMYQRQPGSIIRYFIKIIPADSKLSTSPALEFITDESNRFYSVAVDAATEILGKTSGKKIKPALGDYLARSPSFESLRYYVKGMEKSSSYNEIALNTALVWFEKSTQMTYAFLEPYAEKARVLFMLSLLEKNQGKDFALHFGEAVALINIYKTQGKKDPVASIGRFMAGGQAYLMGAANLTGRRYGNAVSNLENAVKLTPEDGPAHELLSQAYGQTGNSKAAEEKQKANSLESL